VTLPFKIEAQAGTARLGRIQTAHGTLETPVFMPVVQEARAIFISGAISY